MVEKVASQGLVPALSKPNPPLFVFSVHERSLMNVSNRVLSLSFLKHHTRHSNWLWLMAAAAAMASAVSSKSAKHFLLTCS